jgi:hypothetical protein
MNDFDWAKVIEEAAMHGKFEIMTSDNPEKEHDGVLYTAQALQAYVTMLDEAGYGDLPGWMILEFLSAIIIALYKTVGVDIES